MGMVAKFQDTIRSSEFWNKYFAEEIMKNILENDTYREFFAKYNITQEHA
jgi:hypothetical protein